MSGRRGYDSVQPGTSISHQDPYKRWVPPAQVESNPDRPRHKATSGQVRTADRRTERHSEGKHRSSSRDHRTEGYIASSVPPPASSYQYIPTAPTARNPPNSSRPLAPAVKPSQPAPSSSHAPLSTSTHVYSRSYPPKSQQEPYDQRTPSHKRAATTPTPQSSYERVYDSEDHAKDSRPGQPSRSGYATDVPTGQRLSAMPISSQGPASFSRKHRDKERENERERERERLKERSERQREREKDRTDDRHRERDRAQERDIHQETRRETEKDASRRQQRSMAQHSLPTREYSDPRYQDADSSDSARRPPIVHRRHRTEEGTSATSTVRQRHREATQPSSSLVHPRQVPVPGSSNTAPPTQQSAATTYTTSVPRPPNPRDGQENNPPPTPYVMPVYLPDKSQKPQKSHHDRAVPMTANQQQSSGSDTEYPSRREHRHRTKDQSNESRTNPLQGPRSTLESSRHRSSSRVPTIHGERVPESVTNIQSLEMRHHRESKYLPTQSNSRSQEVSAPEATENRVEIPLVTPAFPTTQLPAESHHLRSGAPQFVSIRAGQGPSDPQYTLSKAPVSSYPDVTPTPWMSTRSSRPTAHDRSQSHDVSSRPRAMPSSQSRSQAKNVEADNVALSSSVPSVHASGFAGPLDNTALRSSSSRVAEVLSQPPATAAISQQNRPPDPPSVPQLSSLNTGLTRPPPSPSRDYHVGPQTSQAGRTQPTSYSGKSNQLQVPGVTVTAPSGIMSQQPHVTSGSVHPPVARRPKSARKVSFQLDSDDPSSSDQPPSIAAPTPASATPWPQSQTSTGPKHVVIPLAPPVVSKSSSSGSHAMDSQSSREAKKAELPAPVESSYRNTDAAASSRNIVVQQTPSSSPSYRENLQGGSASVPKVVDNARILDDGKTAFLSTPPMQNVSSSPSRHIISPVERSIAPSNVPPPNQEAHPQVVPSQQQNPPFTSGSSYTYSYPANANIETHTGIALSTMPVPTMPVHASHAPMPDVQSNVFLQPKPQETPRMTSTPPRSQLHGAPSRELGRSPSTPVSNSSPRLLKQRSSSYDVPGHVPSPSQSRDAKEGQPSPAPGSRSLADPFPKPLTRPPSSHSIYQHALSQPVTSKESPFSPTVPPYPLPPSLSQSAPESFSHGNSQPQALSSQSPYSTSKQPILSSSVPSSYPNSNSPPKPLAQRTSSQNLHQQSSSQQHSYNAKEPAPSSSLLSSYPTSSSPSRPLAQRTSSQNLRQQPSPSQQVHVVSKESTPSSAATNSYPFMNPPSKPLNQGAGAQNMRQQASSQQPSPSVPSALPNSHIISNPPKPLVHRASSQNMHQQTTSSHQSQSMYYASSQPYGSSSQPHDSTSKKPTPSPTVPAPSPTVASRPLGQRTSSNNMRDVYASSSRPDEQRTTQPSAAYPINLYRSPSRTAYPEASNAQMTFVAPPKTEDLPRPESRAAVPAQYPLYSNPQQPKSMSQPAPTPQSYEVNKTSQVYPSSQHYASLPAVGASTATRTTSKAYGSSSRQAQPDSSSRPRGPPPAPSSGAQGSSTQAYYAPGYRSTTTQAASYPQPPTNTQPQSTQSTQNASTPAAYNPASVQAQPGSVRTQAYPSANSVRPPMPATSNGSQPYHSQSSSVSTRVPLSRTGSNDTVLMTPSSLAPSVLKPMTSRPPTQPPSPKPSQESRKKGGGFLSMFRSRTNPPKEREAWNPPASSKAAEHQRSQSDPKASVPTATGSNVKVEAPRPLRGKAPPPVAVPIPVPTSGRKSPKMFSPFRFVSTKRNRTVSAASLEAQDGTANNTVVGSPTQSNVSQAPGLQPPPLRDPLLAAQDWRNIQEAELSRGTGRRRRPGVTFDVEEERPPAYAGQGQSQGRVR